MTAPSPLWSDAQATLATHGHANAAFLANGVQIDSRAIEPNDLFIAIQGVNQDGHKYVSNAAKAGAAAAVVAQGWADNAGESPLPLVAVPDTFRALYDLAEHARVRSAAKRIAITGSMGKTGSKESMAAALGKLGKTHHTHGNQNNQYGLPLTLARLPEDAAFGVFEIGMDHAGEIEPLSILLKPEVAVITTVAPVHLEFFNHVGEIADAKAEIFAGLNQDGTAVLPIDNEWFGHLTERARERGVRNIVSFGCKAGADFKLINASTASGRTNVVAQTPIGPLEYTIGLPGTHWALNTLAVLAAIHAIGGDIGTAARGFKDLQPGAGRGERTVVELPDGGRVIVIDESYNANADSVNAALQVARMTADENGGRCIAVLGDIRELGDAAAKMHADLAPRVLANRIDRVFLCGPHMKNLSEALQPEYAAHHTEHSEDLVTPIIDTLQDKDTIVVKGSLGTNMRPIVEALKNAGTGVSEGKA